MSDFMMVFITVMAWCGVFVGAMHILTWLYDKSTTYKRKRRNLYSENRKPTKCKQYGCGGRSSCVVDSTYECPLFTKKPIPKPKTKKVKKDRKIAQKLHTISLCLGYLWIGYLIGSLMNLILTPIALLITLLIIVLSLFIVTGKDVMMGWCSWE